MLPSTGHIALQVDDPYPWVGQEHIVNTSFGLISVFVCGEPGKPALITYPDVALNCVSCFQGLFCCPEASSVLLDHFCIYHISAPGHEVGASLPFPDQPMLTVDDLADQVAEVLDFFGLEEVIGMGVTAGAYILTLFAMKYRERAVGLILISPLCQTPSWTEWFCNKLLLNLFYFYGMCSVAKEMLLRRFFSQDTRLKTYGEHDIVLSCRRMLDEQKGQNVLRFLQAINSRPDLSSSLKKLKCRTLIFVGEHSPFRHEALHMSHEMDRKYHALVEVQACGSLVTEEIPHSMLIPIEYFLMGYGFYRPIQLATRHSAPSRPLGPPCISAELLSPQSLGLKLKPIKTRPKVCD